MYVNEKNEAWSVDYHQFLILFMKMPLL